MLTSRFSQMRKATIGAVFSDPSGADFWDARFLPRWLPILLGLVLGISAAVLITNQAWHLLVPLTLLVPAVIVFSRYPFASVLLWILLVPFFVITPSAAGRNVFWMLHRAMIPAALIVVIFSDWLGVRKRETARFGWPDVALLLFLLYGLANILLLSRGVERELVRFYDRLIVPVCMYWLVRLIGPREQDFRRLLPVAFVTVVAQSAIGLLSWFAPGTLPRQWLGQAGARTVGTFGNPAVYTSTLIFLSLLLLQYAMNTQSRRVRALLFPTVGLAMYCVFQSFSRGSWLGGLAVLLGLILVYPRSMVRFSGVIAVLTLILSGTILVPQIAWATERYNDVRTAYHRTIGNAASIKMIQTKPWFGWGYGNYDLYDTEFIESVGEIGAAGYTGTSHNTYLSIMAEMGLIGFAFFVFPVLWWLRQSLKVRRRLLKRGFWSGRLLALLWLLMLDHFIVSNFMDMTRFNLFGTTIWFMVLALVGSLVHDLPKPTEVASPSHSALTARSTGMI